MKFVVFSPTTKRGPNIFLRLRRKTEARCTAQKKKRGCGKPHIGSGTWCAKRKSRKNGAAAHRAARPASITHNPLPFFGGMYWSLLRTYAAFRCLTNLCFWLQLSYDILPVLLSPQVITVAPGNAVYPHRDDRIRCIYYCCTVPVCLVPSECYHRARAPHTAVSYWYVSMPLCAFTPRCCMADTGT